MIILKTKKYFILIALMYISGCANDSSHVAHTDNVQSKNNDISTFYTEKRNAASSAIGTMNFVVGKMANECYPSLNKNESFTKELVGIWQSKNYKYLKASTDYLSSEMQFIEQWHGAEALKNMQAELSSAVRGQGAQTVNNLLSKGEKLSTCEKFVSDIKSGKYDVKPGFPEYETLNALVILYP